MPLIVPANTDIAAHKLGRDGPGDGSPRYSRHRIQVDRSK